MKKSLFFSIVLLMFAFVSSSFTVANESEAASQEGTMITVMTDANGEIADIEGVNEVCWNIRDLSGYTNIRNKPNGKVCMRLKANTQYNIYTNGIENGWLHITSIYNLREGYWVRLHSSSTGTYWIARSILFAVN